MARHLKPFPKPDGAKRAEKDEVFKKEVGVALQAGNVRAVYGLETYGRSTTSAEQDILICVAANGAPLQSSMAVENQ
jgi:hypothetical protein